jgi:hypothetical protein
MLFPKRRQAAQLQEAELKVRSREIRIGKAGGLKIPSGDLEQRI